MKEYKTLRVYPEEEEYTLQHMEKCNWVLENRQEVYNTQERIVGITTETKAYGDFMRGFTGKDGYSKTNVQTVEDVTHYISLQFSRETMTSQHKRIVELENKLENFKFTPPVPEKAIPNDNVWTPVIGFIIAIALVCAYILLCRFGSGMDGLIAIACLLGASFVALYTIWTFVEFLQRKAPKIKEENRKIRENNAKIKQKEEKDEKDIIDELAVLLVAEREELRTGKTVDIAVYKEIQQKQQNAD